MALKYQAYLTQTHSTSSLVFYSHNYSHSERMRIDSSGNLLVGMTSASTNNDGVGLRADGLIHAKRADVVATFNRKTSDGTVVQILKRQHRGGEYWECRGLFLT